MNRSPMQVEQGGGVLDGSWICVLTALSVWVVVYGSAFALLAWRKPHIVILDEPTNHLDMNTIDALCEAVSAYHPLSHT